MEWLNLHTSTLDAPEFVGAEPHERATWLCLLRFCIGQENGGRIEGAKLWADRRWQQLCRVTKREVSMTSELWTWEEDNLVVWAYPLDKEEEVKRNRTNGLKGGRPPGSHQKNPKETTRLFSGSTSAETEGEGEGEGEERKDKEKGNAKGGTDVPPLDPQPAKQGLTARPSSFAEVDAYFADPLGALKSDAEEFFDHFTANGWKVGRTAMKDWRAAARNWVRRSGYGPRGGSRSTDGGGQAGKNRAGAAGGDDRDRIVVDLAEEAKFIAETRGESPYPAGYEPREDAYAPQGGAR